MKDICNKCKQYFDIIDLVSDKRLKRGYKNLCKSCQSSAYKEYVSKNKTKLHEQRKEAYNKNIKPKLNQYLQTIIDKDPIRYRSRIIKNCMIQSSKKRNMEYDESIVNIDYIYSLLLDNRNCQCCDKIYSYEFKFDGSCNLDTPSIDRTNNSIGYIKNNIELICWECNNIKNNGTIEELKTVVNWLESKLI
jgi:hypothetical protein